MGDKIKKLLSVLLATAILITAAPLAGYALSEENVLDYLTYWIYNGEVTIMSCDKSFNGDLSIPATIEGCPVIGIGEHAFKDCTGLTNIIIPNNVEWIDDFAFENCTALTSIEIPDSLSNLDYGVFENCTAMKAYLLAKVIKFMTVEKTAMQ